MRILNMSRGSNGLRPAADFLFFWRAVTMVGRKISHLTTLFSRARGSPFLSRRLSMICWSKSPGCDMAVSSVKAMRSMGEKTHIQYYIRKPASYQLNNKNVDRKNLTVFAILLITTAIISHDALMVVVATHPFMVPGTFSPCSICTARTA